jgi:hypothetical protein
VWIDISKNALQQAYSNKGEELNFSGKPDCSL